MFLDLGTSTSKFNISLKHLKSSLKKVGSILFSFSEFRLNGMILTVLKPTQQLLPHLKNIHICFYLFIYLGALGLSHNLRDLDP